MARSRSYIVITALLLAAISGTLLAVATASSAYAQNATVGGMQQPTSGNSVDVRVEPTWGNGNQDTFKVSFLKHGTNTVQIHIDYSFVIMQNGQKVFDAAPSGQQGPLHTAEGVVTIPYTFKGNGDYTIQVSVSGINFVPMNPETATFPIKVTPEFPLGAIGAAMAALIGATVILTRRFNLGLRI